MNGGGMSDLTITDNPHLPECFAVTYTKVVEAVIVLPGTDLNTTNLGKTVEITEGDCICDRLRACEQRIARTREGNGELWLDGYGTGFQDGHTYTLDAAREAIAALPLKWNSVSMAADVLAAIDALREEQR